MFENCKTSNSDRLSSIYYNGTDEDWAKVTAEGLTENRTALKYGSEDEIQVIYNCQISFDTDGGTSVKPITVIKGEKIPENQLPEVPVKDGFTFEGWYQNDEKVELTANTEVAESIHLVAHWKQNAAVVVEGISSDVSVKPGKPQEFTITVNANDETVQGALKISGNAAESIEYKDENELDEGEQWKLIPEGGLSVSLQTNESKVFVFRVKPLEEGEQELEISVTRENAEPLTGTLKYTVSEMPILTVKNGKITVTLNGDLYAVDLDHDGKARIPEGAKVKVAFDTEAFSDSNSKFSYWQIKGLTQEEANTYYNQESFEFTMPTTDVELEGMTQDATIEDDGPDILGTAAMIGVGVAGTAVLGYQGYMIGTELYLNSVLPAGAAIPQNTAELAKLVWTDAGKPEPVALLATDAAEEQKALTWAVENQLISADKAADASVGRWEVIYTWNKAQEMKK